MIKTPSNLLFGCAWLLLAALSFPDRNRQVDWPLHRYVWLMWLIGSAVWFYRSLQPPPAPGQRRRLMKEIPPGKLYAACVVLFVGVFLAAPLGWEFYEPDQPLWNGALSMLLIALVVGSFAGVRYMQRNHIEVGEARFTTTESDAP